jgi:hypothetical protein
MINKKLVVAACCVLSSIAYAERPVVEHGLIAGASVQLGSYEEDDGDSISPIGGLLSLEKPLTDNFSLRVDYAFGLEGDTTEIGTTEVDVSLVGMFSGSAKVQTSDIAGFRLYGLLGVSKAEFRAEVIDSDAETTDGDTGLSYGLGVTAGIKPGLTVNGEFVSYLSEDDYSYSGFNFGLSKLF